MDIDEIANRLKDYPDPREAVKRESLPLTVIEYGTARIVAENPNNQNVLKFAVGHGIEQNKYEIKVTELSKQKGFESDVASVIDSSDDGSWIEMERVTCPDNIGYGKIVGPNSNLIHERLKSHGVLLYEVETGYIGDNAVAYDYGTVTTIRD